MNLVTLVSSDIVMVSAQNIIGRHLQSRCTITQSQQTQHMEEGSALPLRQRTGL